MWLVCLFVLQHAHEKPKLQESKAVSTISMKANAGPGNIGILEQYSIFHFDSYLYNQKQTLFTHNAN